MTVEPQSRRVAPPPGRRLARNSLFNLIGLGSPLLIAVVAIPPLVDRLGAERFGILGLVWVGLAYLALLDLGLGRATTRHAAAVLSRGSQSELGAILVSAGLLQLALGVLGGGALALASRSLVGHFLTVDPALEQDAWRSIAIMAAAAPLVTATASVRGLLEADQRFGVVNAVRVPVGAANFVVPLIGVWLGAGLPAIVAGLVAVRALALLMYAGLCLRRWPSLLRAAPSRAWMRELLSFGGWVTVSALAGALLVYADRIAVGAFVSMDAVGYYTVPHEIVTRLLILPSSLVLALFPALAALSVDDADAGRRARLMSQAQTVLLLLVMPGLLTLAAAADDVLALWLGPEFARQAGAPLALLAVGAAANALAVVPHAALQAAGRPSIPARLHLLELPVHMLLLWWLVPRWGIEGAALVWAVRNALDAALQTIAARRTGIAAAGTWQDVSRRLLVGIIVLALLLAAAERITTGAFTGVLVAVVVLAAWTAVAARALLRPEDRERLRRVLPGAGSGAGEPGEAQVEGEGIA